MMLPSRAGGGKTTMLKHLATFRRGSQRELAVTVAELEPDRSTRRAQAPEPRAPSGAQVQTLGLTVSELTDTIKRELKVRGGVRVEASEGAGARAGLREGDVIVAVGNVDVNSVREFEQAVARADKSKPIVVQYRRGELAQYALIRPAR